MGSRLGARPIGFCVLVGLVGAALIAGCGGGGSSTSSESSATETASSEEASAGGTEWVTNGGSLTNDRFSPLTEINAENVKELKGDGFNSPGILTAYDLEEGKIAWQEHFPESCYSGAVTTAGGPALSSSGFGPLALLSSL